ncbi:hypothetical protein TRIUR3_15521 [Triticum urartu]|uniref:Uncharacterized protein n=1 Tax=Triticum urartu TaxID=4572 RepID=M8ATQ2_TRIUA|nr:hypothetical protein TRIUR3_15521 [Triticum urartu]
METAISAVAGELVSQFISFLINKYNSLSHARSEEKGVERLQHLLMRAGTIVEEADARYITNSGMMMQLKTLSEAMYRGYCVLDNSWYHALQDKNSNMQSKKDRREYIAKRSRITNDMATCLESHGALESLEIAVANMAEFAVLLGGFERLSRRPYDVYLYTDNFMFARHAEKQKLLSFLLQRDATTGKKSLVAHMCGDERVRSSFSSVLHLNGDNLLRILDHGRTMEGMILIVIEFASDVSDDDWKRFHSFVITMGRGRKIIIISKLERLARFGSVKPIFLSLLTDDKLRYLFKKLAFGSVDPAEHPRLVQIVDEFAKVLQNMEGSIVATNLYADVLRKNLNVQFWRCILDKGRRYANRNHKAVQQGHPLDITDFALCPLSMTHHITDVSIKEESPSVTLGKILADPSVRPKGDFTLITWESRIPPHKSFAHFVTSRADDTHQGRALPGRKRRGVPI